MNKDERVTIRMTGTTRALMEKEATKAGVRLGDYLNGLHKFHMLAQRTPCDDWPALLGALVMSQGDVTAARAKQIEKWIRKQAGVAGKFRGRVIANDVFYDAAHEVLPDEWLRKIKERAKELYEAQKQGDLT